MSVRNLSYLGLLLLLFCNNWAFAQNCQFTIRGQVMAAEGELPLAYADVFIEEQGAGTVADEDGTFELSGLCAGEYRLRISYLNYESQELSLRLPADTLLQIRLQEQTTTISGVTIIEKRNSTDGALRESLGEEALQQGAGANIAGLVGTISGVSTVKNGSGISKPVIHGLTGNRIAILNNGLVQAGQQWGTDHAPEVDPFMAQEVTVVKGVEGILYGGNTLGGAVLLAPGNIAADQELHTSTHYAFQGNGRQHTFSSRWEKSSPLVDWRILATVKDGGDRNTPNYYLRNTGLRERNVAGQLQKSFNDRWFHKLYYSYFQTDLGILRGAHIGNLTDLDLSIGREEPFFTEPAFSRRLEAPRQRVEHHLLKYENKYFLTDNQFLRFTYGVQVNHRQEFDIRRGDRSDQPALDLQLFSHFLGAHWQRETRKSTQKAGIQYRFNENDNQPGTGILPLIPDYESHQLGAYWLYGGQFRSFDWQVGSRLDRTVLDVAAISKDLPRRVEFFDHQFTQFSLAGGLEKHWHKHWHSQLNIGLAQRAPEVNELYSNGLHQGVSGIEEGQQDLTPESSIKLIWTNELEWGDHFMFQLSTYYQQIQDFIYLQAEEEFRLTIRGAFPVFTYQQNDARLAGLDATSNWELMPNWNWQNSYAMVRGQNLDNDEPLVSMPADNWTSQLSRSWSAWGQFTEPRLSLSSQYVWRQNRLLPAQDFLAPPAAYHLLNLSFATAVDWGRGEVNFFVEVSNVLNTRYRDYLNRLRYYADEEGRNLKVSLRYSF